MAVSPRHAVCRRARFMRLEQLSIVPILAFAACGGSTPSETTGGAGGATTTSATTTSSATLTGGAGGMTTTTTTATDAGVDAPDPHGPWAFTTAMVDPLPAVWGAMVAQESPTVAYQVGGVAGKTGPVIGKVFRVEQGGAGVLVNEVASTLTPRYCGCAMVDTNRSEIVTLGGRNGSFVEKKTAELVNVTTGAVTALDPGEAANHPVGCHAVFLADRDEGYVFGGAGQSAGFGADIFRYNPMDHTFTKLTVTSAPPARYDGVMRYPVSGGAVWLTGGMGLQANKVTFYSDVWKLDPAAGTWTEVPTTGMAPPGRRLPWVAFSEDLGTIVYGFGSDSPMGTTLLGDLWKLDVASGTWSDVPRTMDVQPAARGFATWLPGPSGSAGIINGGLDAMGLAQPALVVQPPVTNVVWR